MSIYDFVLSVIGHADFVDSEKYCYFTACIVLCIMIFTLNKFILHIFGGK